VQRELDDVDPIDPAAGAGSGSDDPRAHRLRKDLRTAASVRELPRVKVGQLARSRFMTMPSPMKAPIPIVATPMPL
jgi:hypothetical protein